MLDYRNSASISGSLAKENGQENVITYTPSTVNANNELNIKSGQDTNIIGSQVAGDKVTADIGGNLNIESLQETNTYKSDSQYAGGSISIGSGGGIQGSAGMGKIKSDYQSVTDQAGIYAGDKGFDITVGKNTDLKGAVIDSNATPDKNKLETGTLSFSDIDNKAEYSASNIGVGIDTRPANKAGEPKDSGKADRKDAGVTPDISIGAKDDSKSTTKSGVSAGTIEVTDKDKQKQDVDKLNRDTKNTLNKLEQIFDKKTVQERQELAKVFGEVAYKEVHRISNQYGWAEGSPEKIALHALIGGIMAQLGGGDFASGATAAGINEAIQNELSKIKDPALHQWASAIVGAAVAEAIGGDAQTGASTSASGTKNNILWEHIPEFRQSLKDIDVSSLPEGYCRIVSFGIDAGIGSVGDSAIIFNTPNTDIFSSGEVAGGLSVSLPGNLEVGKGWLEGPDGNIITDPAVIRKEMQGISLGGSVSVIAGRSVYISPTGYKFNVILVAPSANLSGKLSYTRYLGERDNVINGVFK